MAEFDPVWAVDGEVSTPTEAEIRAGFSCGPASPGRFNWLFQTLMSVINNLNITDMASKFRLINTTEGITGGGNLEEDRTLRLDFAGLEEAEAIANDDLVAIFDTSANAHRKITRTAFVAGLGGEGGSVAGAENIGTGDGAFFSGLSGSILQFRKLLNAGGLTIGVASNDVTIALADMGSDLTIE